MSEDTHWNPTNMIYGDNPRDPLGLNIYTPDTNAIRQSTNLYVYCGNNPILYIDPNGNAYELTAGFAGSMWWLCLADSPVLPFGDIVYGMGVAGCAVGDSVNVIGVDNIVRFISEGPNAIKQTANNVGNWFNKTFGGGSSSGSPGPDKDPFKIVSRINESNALTKEAGKLGNAAQKDVDILIKAFQNGNTNPGIGTKHLVNDIFYLRGSNGGRVFFRMANGAIEILGKADKRLLSSLEKRFYNRRIA